MDIDLVNDLRRDDDDDNESDENNGKLRRDDSDNEESKATDVEAVMKKANEAAKKKVARRPRPKLDADRLIGPRGLEELCNIFQNEKFQGRGHEFTDLDTLMHKYEYWAHRLVPHMAFDDFIEKAEKLGGKRQIKNVLQQLRDKLNIPESSNENEQASHTLVNEYSLIDLLPTLNPSDTNDIANNDIPDDDELNELLQ